MSSGWDLEGSIDIGSALLPSGVASSPLLRTEQVVLIIGQIDTWVSWISNTSEITTIASRRTIATATRSVALVALVGTASRSVAWVPATIAIASALGSATSGLIDTADSGLLGVDIKLSCIRLDGLKEGVIGSIWDSRDGSSRSKVDSSHLLHKSIVGCFFSLDVG